MTVQDLDARRLAGVVQRAAALFRRKLKEPVLVQAALDRLVPDPAGGGVARADLVIEAIFEDPDAKRDLYRRLEPRMRAGRHPGHQHLQHPPGAAGRGPEPPGRFLGLHFFNPVAKMPLVEVVTAATAPGAPDRAIAFVGAIRRLPLPVKSSPGFLVNRILVPYLIEALTLVERGVPPGGRRPGRGGLRHAHGPGAAGRHGGPGHLPVRGAHPGRALAAGSPAPGADGGGAATWARNPARASTGSGTAGRRSRARTPCRGPPGAAPHAAPARRGGGLPAGGGGRTRTCVDAGVVFGTGFAPFRGGPLQYSRARPAHHQARGARS